VGLLTVHLGRRKRTPAQNRRREELFMVRERLREFILEDFMFGGSPEQLEDDASLLGTGIIDSTAVMELVAFLEEEFQITVEDKELVPENLDSVNHLCRYLEKKGVAASVEPTASEVQV